MRNDPEKDAESSGDVSGAARYMQVANTAANSSETADQAAYLAIFFVEQERRRSGLQ